MQITKQLADYKVPHEVLFCNEPLPRNHVGKVDKVALRKAWAEMRQPSELAIAQAAQ